MAAFEPGFSFCQCADIRKRITHLSSSVMVLVLVLVLVPVPRCWCRGPTLPATPTRCSTARR